MHNTRIIDAIELPYQRQPQKDTRGLVTDALLQLAAQTGIDLADIDGLGVSSFTLAPDRAIDIAWQLGLNPSWLHDDSNGGISGLNLIQHALGAIATGQATAIVLVAADSFDRQTFARLINNYNATVKQHLEPIQAASPNIVFSLLTKQHQRRHQLEAADYGQLVVQQRQWASQNPNALYRSPLTIDDYLQARAITDALCLYDCVPIASGANALLLVHRDHPLAQRNTSIKIRALQASHNNDHQLGDGLQTGLAAVRDRLWHQAALSPTDIDLCAIYDDYPVMVLVQLQDLGFFPAADIRRFIHESIASQKFKLNTSGGQLSCGQAGTAGSLHGVVELVTQLNKKAGNRQIAPARFGLATGYGMLQYRYCMGSSAIILEASHAEHL